MEHFRFEPTGAPGTMDIGTTAIKSDVDRLLKTPYNGTLDTVKQPPSSSRFAFIFVQEYVKHPSSREFYGVASELRTEDICILLCSAVR